jgi:hypothetical protein
MKTLKGILTALLLAVCTSTDVQAQEYNEMDADGNVTRRSEIKNFNPNRKDSTNSNKEVPKGVWAWTVDRELGDITPVELDTMPHLYQNSIYATGLYGEYNTLGNNYTARLSRIFIDRPQASDFFFTDAYSYTTYEPEDFHFINTLSPYTNLSYENCGDKQHGEDHFRAKFAVNAGKRLGMGFDLDYHYATGYYQNQSNSHFRASLFASYRGDRYQMHLLGTAYHRKATENGGITNDNYITHPELEESQYSEDEIPTVLSRNWNRNNSQNLFFTHRYNIGFYRKVKMTDEEIKARQFAASSAKQKAQREKQGGGKDKLRGRPDSSRRDKDDAAGKAPKGRPSDARIAGDEPAKDKPAAAADSTRIQVEGEQARDSLLAEQQRQDSIDATMKKEYVPVTSIIHTLDIENYDRIYQAYETPADYYADTFYDADDEGRTTGEGIYDKYKFTSIKNTFGIALLEGFNKYMKAGLKGYVSYQFCKFSMPDLTEGLDTYHMKSWNDYGLNVGGRLSKTQGKTFHFNLQAELGVTGRDQGMLRADFSTDLNFALFGDTVRLAASAFFYRDKPVDFMESFHSKHLWWDHSLSAETRTHIEGNFSYEKTDTRLRVAVDEIQNYTYFGMSYEATSEGRKAMTAGVYQNKGNINVLTLQLIQNLRWGIINWENILTYQNSSSKDVLPLPTLNVFTNLYLKFRIARVLNVELGGCMTYFTKYAAPDFVPQLNTFAVQKNSDSRIELGGYPFVDIYANLHLKRARFFAAMSHVNAGSGSKRYFLVPHYPTNTRIFRIGVSWNFYN